jgi:hypothetical protein
MRRAFNVFVCFAISALALLQTALARDENTALLSRPNERFGDDGGYIFDIPRNANEDSSAQELGRSLPTLERKGHALIILSYDPALAARIVRKAFSSCSHNSLRGLDVYCMISSQYDPSIRASVTKTGAVLTTRTQLSKDPSKPPTILKAAGRRAFYKGRRDAWRDIAQNRLVLRGSFPSRPFQKLLRERYKIEAPIIHPYEATSEEWGYDVGCNSISVPEIERRYGKFFIERAIIESRKKAEALLTTR